MGALVYRALGKCIDVIVKVSIFGDICNSHQCFVGKDFESKLKVNTFSIFLEKINGRIVDAHANSEY